MRTRTPRGFAAPMALALLASFSLGLVVLAFAEPYRDRMVLPIDEPSDALYRLITHELTHIFEFDIIPRSLLHRQLPLWVDEGLSDYMTGYWQPFDLMTVRDAAIADIIP